MEVTLRKHDRLEVTLSDGATYVGDLFTYCERSHTIILKNITQNPESFQVPESAKIHLDDIIKLNIIRNHHVPIGECTGSLVPKPLRGMSKGEYFRLLNTQRCYQLVKDGGTIFHTAMVDLQKSKVIGVYGRDPLVGRKKKLQAIAVSNETSIYIFDLLRLRNKPFDKGLRKVFESENVVKIMYDCRLLSDCLYHKHGIKITNVRDVEAEDVVITYNETGIIRGITRQYSSLIQSYLGLPGNNVEEEFLNKKPQKNVACNSKLQNFMAVYVSYLIPLHRSIESYHLQKLTDASRVYCEVLRNTRDLNFLRKSGQFVVGKEMRDLLIPPLVLSKRLSQIDF